MIRTCLPRARFNEGFRPGNVELQFLKSFREGLRLRLRFLKVSLGRAAVLIREHLNASHTLLKEHLLVLFFGHALEDALADQGVDLGSCNFFENVRTIPVVGAKELRKSPLGEHRASREGLQIHA